VKSHARDIARVPFEREHCGRVGGLDIVEFDRVMAGGGEVALVGGDAKPVDLRVWMRYCARADA